MERKFNLYYYLHINLSDYRETEITELRWLYDRLVEQKRKETRKEPEPESSRIYRKKF